MAFTRYGCGLGSFDLDSRDPRDHSDTLRFNGFMAAPPRRAQGSPQSRFQRVNMK